MNDFADLAAFVAHPRITGLAMSPDGARLVATVQTPDRKGARYVSAVWEIPLAGGEPVRLTRSAKGESAPAFRPDGSLVFTSSRPDAEENDDDAEGAALWVLPRAGEARVLARSAGGVSAPVVASATGTVVVTTPNAEHNVRYPGLADGQFRHRDHRFEWTRAEFAGWAEAVGVRYGYQGR